MSTYYYLLLPTNNDMCQVQDIINTFSFEIEVLHLVLEHQSMH